MAGGRRCSICAKSAVEQHLINDAIRSGDSFSAIGRRHNVSRDAVRRHSKHILIDAPPETGTTDLAVPAGEEHKYNFVQDLMELKARALVLLKQAENQQDHGAAVGVMREIRQQIETIIKVALAQRELEQRDIDKEEMDAGIREVSPDVLEVIRRGIEEPELEEVDYEVVDDLGLDDLGGSDE